MAKYLVLTSITIMHPDGRSDDYSRGMIADLEAYTAEILLEKKCIQPATVKPRQGIIKIKELRNGTDYE